MEATIKTLATKDDLAKFKFDLSKKIGTSVKWMFALWTVQFAVIMAFLLMLLKK